MPKQTGKGKSRQSALERKATKHHDFIGEAEPERAEAGFRKRVEKEREQETVPIRIPRSVDEGKRLIRELPEALREKARERLEKLPEPAQKAIQVAGAATQVLLLPMRLGVRLVQEVLRVPLAMLRVLRET